MEYKPSNPNIRRELNEFFKKILPVENVRNFILTDLASILNPTREKSQKFRIWIGEGANGKSTLTNLMSNTLNIGLDGYIGTCNSTLFTRKKTDSDKPVPDLHDVLENDKRFVISQEPQKNEDLNIDIIKELSGGDNIKTRALHKDPITHNNIAARFLLSCNNLPRISDMQYSVWRRFYVTEFPAKFKERHERKDETNFEYERDPSIDEKIQTTWPSEFILMLLDYYEEFKNNGYKRPDTPKEMLAQVEVYKRKFDVVSKWESDCLEPCENGTPIPKKEFKSLFKKWSYDNNNDRPTGEDLDDVYNDKRFKKNSAGCVINVRCKIEEDERTQ